MGRKWRYGIVFDAGSSGTRLYVYKWKTPAVAVKGASDDDLRRLPRLKLVKSKKIRPGVSSFADKPTQIGPDHLQHLIDVALDTIPTSKVADTPVYLMATAGMRLLPPMQQTALLQQICDYFKENTRLYLPDCKAHIQVISGETEGLYGWMATNYLLGGFDHPDEHKHGKGHHTYGFLDMGGASAQIAFAPNKTEAHKHANDLKLVRLRTMNGVASEYKVFTASWLGFGANQARDRYIQSLKETYDLSRTATLLDPCLPKGLRTTLSGDPIDDTYVGDDPILLGQGLFKECLSRTYPLLGKDMPCADEPCLLNGQHVPAIDFDVNHFVGVSEYWHTTHGVFGGDATAYDLTTYQKKVTEFCERDWVDIESSVLRRKKTKAQKAKDAQEACFKASWLINVLHDGIGIPRFGLEKSPESGLNVSQDAVEKAKKNGFLAPFRPVDTIDEIEVSWTLGKMLLYAAGQVPPKGDDRPVGYGSNTPGVTDDFEPAGSTWTHPESNTDDDDDAWGSKAGNFLEDVKERHTAGILVFIIALVLLLLWLRKRDRRVRIIGKVSSLLRLQRISGSPRKAGRGFWLSNALRRRSTVAYERIAEEGHVDQFELGELESDENDHSDSSEGSRRSGPFGTTVPKLGVERFDEVRAPTAIDRSGLVIRTESRERLVPGVQMLTAGRRSRAASPTRLKSPHMTPLQED